MQDFHFLYPWWLLLLLPLALLLWQLRRSRGSGGSAWSKLVDPLLQPYVIVQGEAAQRDRSWWLAALAGMLTVLALAGPAWQKQPQPVHRLQSPLVILLDLSASMYAQDIKPSRLTRARFELSDLLEARREGQTALIVFAGDAFAVTPLTEDSDTILAQVKALSPAIMPAPGSRADLALKSAEKLFEQAGVGSGDILLLTDGIPEPERAAVIARSLAAKGYELSIVGIGSEDGAPIPLPGGGFLKDRQGNMIIPKLEMDALRRVAQAGSGIAITSSVNDSDLQPLLAHFKRHQSMAESDAGNPAEAQLWRNEGVWLLLLLLPLALLTFRRGWAVAVALVMLQPNPSQALEWPQLWQDLWLRSDQQAQRALSSGKPGEAAEKFSDPASKGVANYLAKQYQQSIENLKQIDTASANYNRGNALARLKKYHEAIKAYDRVLAQDQGHENARYNRELVKRELEKQQQSQQQGSDNQQEQAQEQEQQQDNQQQSEEQQSQEQQQEQQGEQPQEQQQEQQGEQSQEQQQQQGEQSQEQQEQQGEQSQEQQQQQGEQSQEQQQQEQQQAAQQQSEEQQSREQLEQQQQDEPQQRRHGGREPMDEREQASEQWLRQIPDDPAGLWRRKFEYQYRQRRRVPQEQTW